jgi:uncharacterized membrane protein
MKVPQSWRLGLKESLVLGLLTLAPLGVTIWVLASVVRFLDDLMYRLIPGLGEIPLYFGFGLPGIGIIATFAVLLATGLIAKTFAGRMFNNFSDSLIGRLPVLSGLYGVTKQISSVFFSQSPTSAFKKVVYVPFPSSESRSLAFVASQVGDDHVLVFVPTAPNPTSGYVLRYHRSQLEDTTITIDAALQLIISCGALGQGKSNELPKV